MKNIKIGTRKSPLALYQAEKVKEELLQKNNDLTEKNIEIVKFITSGDKFLVADISKIGGKEIFTKEIELALLNNEIDIAVHSAKDVPAILNKNLEIAGYLKRASCNDAFISQKYQKLADLEKGSVLGTSSIRRKSAILQKYPHLNIINIRGSVGTRIEKMKKDNLAGIILAEIGVIRLKLEYNIKEILPHNLLLPSAGQGAIALETRKTDSDILPYIKNINCLKTEISVNLEREFMKDIDGSCKTPIGVLVSCIDNEFLQIQAEIIHPKKLEKHKKEKICKLADAKNVILAMSKELQKEAKEVFKFIAKD